MFLDQNGIPLTATVQPPRSQLPSPQAILEHREAVGSWFVRRSPVQYNTQPSSATARTQRDHRQALRLAFNRLASSGRRNGGMEGVKHITSWYVNCNMVWLYTPESQTPE
jgi:hypothetical protein